MDGWNKGWLVVLKGMRYAYDKYSRNRCLGIIYLKTSKPIIKKKQKVSEDLMESSNAKFLKVFENKTSVENDLERYMK